MSLHSSENYRFLMILGDFLIISMGIEINWFAEIMLTLQSKFGEDP